MNRSAQEPRVINKVVLFKDGFAQVILCDDISPYIGRPECFVNPNLSHVAHVAPEFWENRNGTIAIMADEEKVSERAAQLSVGAKITMTADGIAWMRQMTDDMKALQEATHDRLEDMKWKLAHDLANAHNNTVGIVRELGKTQVGETRFFTDTLLSMQKAQETQWANNKRNLLLAAIISLVLMGIAGGILYGR